MPSYPVHFDPDQIGPYVNYVRGAVIESVENVYGDRLSTEALEYTVVLEAEQWALTCAAMLSNGHDGAAMLAAEQYRYLRDQSDDMSDQQDARVRAFLAQQDEAQKFSDIVFGVSPKN